MRKSPYRLFMLTIGAMAMLIVATVLPGKAAGNRSGEVEKTGKKSQNHGSSDLRSPMLERWPPPMQDDFDRRNGGGSGM